jgi:hypothetical protein
MHHCSFNHGLSLFFKHLPYRLGGDGVHDLQLDELVGQQPQRPAGPPSARVGAGQGDQAGLAEAIELPLAAAALLNPNRGKDVVRHTIGQLRELVAGFRHIFSGACT